MKTVIIHLGTHKAASTSVQLFLSHNRENLKAMGVCYPEAPAPTGFAHHGLAWTIIRRYTKLERRPANFSLNDALAAFVESDGHTLMLSSEDFLTTAFYDGFLDEFFAELKERFDKVVVCAYVRSRKDFFNSSYNQWIKSLSYSKDFEHYLRQVLSGLQAPMHYTKALSAWAERADSSVFLPFIPSVFGAQPETYLLHQLGFSAAETEHLEAFTLGAVNASIGPRAIVAFRRLSARLHEQDWYDHYALAKREILLHELEAKAQAMEWNHDKFRALSEQQAAKVREVFAKDDDLFASTYLGTPWSELFPQDKEVDKSTELDYERLGQVLQRDIDQFVDDGLLRAKQIYCDDASLETVPRDAPSAAESTPARPEHISGS